MATKTIIQKLLGTFIGRKNKQIEIIEDVIQYEFCDDIWKQIKEFAGWNYQFDLNLFDENGLANIIQRNFPKNKVPERVSLRLKDCRKKYQLKPYCKRLIYNYLRTNATKQMYEDIVKSYNYEISRRVDKRVKVGDEVLFLSHYKYKIGRVKYISTSRLDIHIQPYSYQQIGFYQGQQLLYTKTICNKNILEHYVIFEEEYENLHCVKGTKEVVAEKCPELLKYFN
jgi:hypothetical protein